MKAFQVLLFISCCLVIIPTDPAESSKNDGLRQEPAALGASLYRDKCRRCHVDYEQERLAADFDTEDALAEAIGENGCRISWSKKAGGSLSTIELQAVAVFLMKWEREGEEPLYDDLPSLPKERITETGEKVVKEPPPVENRRAPDEMDSSLKQLIQTNQIVQGGWLYTRNCYRCHLSYETARMGRGLSPEMVQQFISEGKTSTQMKPFARLFGGSLKNSEIRAIVSYIQAWEQAGEPLAIAEQLMTPPALDPSDFVPITLPRIKQINGDGVAGSALFLNNCSRCHGREAEGYIGVQLREVRWVQRVDLFMKSVIKQGVPGSLMPAWDRNAGGSLSAKDVDDVVVFLANLPRSQ